jgi:aminoglycoside/choline kinase family phosphotransferase
MCFARPCALPNRSVDAKFPGSDATFPEHRLPDDDRYHEAKYKIVQLMESVIEEQTRTTRGSYAHVLSIDNDILSFRNSLPESMIPAAKASSLSMESDIHPHTVLHRLSIRLLVMETRIYLHRTYFVQALHHVSP